MKKSRGQQEIELARGCRQLGMAWNSDAGKMFAFLCIFHPEMSLRKRLRLAAEQSHTNYVSPVR